jgi:hypothetical protein
LATVKGGLFVKLRGIEEEDLVRVTISARARLWRSDYESVDTVDIQCPRLKAAVC